METDRDENCFRCWHCRRVEGMSCVCVCTANMAKRAKPEFIEDPFGGKCPTFYDKEEEERGWREEIKKAGGRSWGFD